MSNQLAPINNGLIKSATLKHGIVQKIMSGVRHDLPELIPYRKGDKWGFCDRNKRIMIDCEYEKVNFFPSDLAIVRKGGIDMLINKNGEILFNSYGEIFSLGEDEYDCYMNVYIEELEKVELYLIFRKDNEISFDNSYMQYGRPFDVLREGLIAVELNRKWGFVNKKGERVIECVFEEVESFNNGVAKVKLNNEWYLIDKKGSIKNKIIKEEVKVAPKTRENRSTDNSESKKLVKPVVPSVEEEGAIRNNMCYSNEKNCYLDLVGNEYWED